MQPVLQYYVRSRLDFLDRTQNVDQLLDTLLQKEPSLHLWNVGRVQLKPEVVLEGVPSEPVATIVFVVSV